MWACQTDWAATGSMLSGLSGVALAILAIYGLNVWKRQEMARSRADAAAALLYNAQLIRDALDPLIHLHESFVSSIVQSAEKPSHSKAIAIASWCNKLRALLSTHDDEFRLAIVATYRFPSAAKEVEATRARYILRSLQSGGSALSAIADAVQFNIDNFTVPEFTPDWHDCISQYATLRPVFFTQLSVLADYLDNNEDGLRSIADYSR